MLAKSELRSGPTPPGTALSPKFLAHITENGRVIGVLLEKIDGSPAGIDDLPKCEALVRSLHGQGLIHGDVNRYNLMVNNDMVKAVDFEHAQVYNEQLARLEIDSLPEELAEETGRGGTRIISNS